MIRAITHRIRQEGGSTLLELSLVLIGLAILASTMIGFFVGVTSTDAVHRADDAALEDARNARALMSRDVREARRFTSIGPLGFTVWIDEQWDDITTPSELITWSIDATGALLRTQGTGPGLTAAVSIAEEESLFTYDSDAASEVGSVDMHLVVVAGGSHHVVDTHISLRNVP